MPEPESEHIEEELIEPSSSRMAFAEEINIENAVELSSSQVPKSKMVPNAAASKKQASQLLAPSINVPNAATPEVCARCVPC